MAGWRRDHRSLPRRPVPSWPGSSATSDNVLIQLNSQELRLMAIKLTVNNQAQELDVDPDMPLLWAIRDHLKLTGTKFGCGMALCGACTVHIDGQPTRSCVTPVSAVAGKTITTIEGLATPAGKAVQAAWVNLDVPQCGYCQSGQIMSASALLATNSKPTD